MQLENIWKWLDAVDEDHLEPLDQWDLSTLQGFPQDFPRLPQSVLSGDMATFQPYNESHTPEDASFVRSNPPAKVLLRNGSIRTTRKSENGVSDVENKNHPQSLQAGLGTGLEMTFPVQQRRGAPSFRQLQLSGREGNIDSFNHKKLPPFPERPRVRSLSEAVQSNPIILDDVKEPTAIGCEGARVLGGYQHDGLKDLPRTLPKLHGDINAGERVLHRSNAVRRPSNLRADPKARPGYW